MSAKKSVRHSASPPLLDVYLRDRLVGYLGQDQNDLWFRYTDGTISAADPAAHQLSVRLPVREEAYDRKTTLAFFDNLLLESDTREAVARATQHDQRDVPGLLGQVGGECAGAVALWPHGTEPPASERYRSYSTTQLATLFDEAHGPQLTRAQLDSRQSMSGVQEKLVLRKRGTAYDLPLDGAPGNVILKRPSRLYPGLVENEYACQRLVEAMDLDAASPDALLDGLYLFESTRYDRQPTETGGLRRLHQEDFCQATGRVPKAKYQHDGGPGFGDLTRVLRRHSTQVAIDLHRLARMAIANLCVGNTDAHAKNFSLLYADGGLRLAPFYDVVSTLVYPELTPAYAMYIGGASRPHELNPHAFERLARDMEFTPAEIRETIDEVTTTIEARWPTVSAAAIQRTGHAAVYDQLDRVIRTQCALVRQAAIKPSSPKHTPGDPPATP